MLLGCRRGEVTIRPERFRGGCGSFGFLNMSFRRHQTVNSCRKMSRAGRSLGSNVAVGFARKGNYRVWQSKSSIFPELSLSDSGCGEAKAQAN